MVRAKPITRRNRIHRRTRLQRLGNDQRLDLVRPATLTIPPYLYATIPEKLTRSCHRETPAPISVRRGIAGQTIGRKVGARNRLPRTTDLVQKLQVARRELQLEAAIAKLDKFDLLILDDLAYVTKDQAETSVLFELISARYERRSVLITANQTFGEWNRVFPDPAMTLAAVDRLVHHATIFEMNVESYRRRSAMEAKRSRGRPASFATINNKPQIVAERQSNQNQALACDNQSDTVTDTAT